MKTAISLHKVDAVSLDRARRNLHIIEDLLIYRGNYVILKVIWDEFQFIFEWNIYLMREDKADFINFLFQQILQNFNEISLRRGLIFKIFIDLKKRKIAFS